MSSLLFPSDKSCQRGFIISSSFITSSSVISLSGCYTKHIDIRHRFIQQGIAQGEYKVQWLPTEEQQADMLTKALDRSTFTYLTTKAMTGE